MPEKRSLILSERCPRQSDERQEWGQQLLVIVLDEQLHGQSTFASIEAWYRGRVTSITALRPGTVIKDDAIPGLLHRAKQPTFVTINVSDFWRKMPAHQAYCIVAFDLPMERIPEVSDLLRRFLRLPGFSARPGRMGKVVRIRPRLLEWYGGDSVTRSLAWTSR